MNGNVDEAVEVAEDCGVVPLGQQKDFFGSLKQLPAEWLNGLSQRVQRCAIYLFLLERLCSSCVTVMRVYFVDSHSNRDFGFLIASAPPRSGQAFSKWLHQMMTCHWNCPLTIGSVTEVVYSEKPINFIAMQ